MNAYCPTCQQPLGDPLASLAVEQQIDRSIANSEAEVADFERLQRQLQWAVGALREIAERPVVERNPDGDDQAAHTMRMIAREALERLAPYSSDPRSDRRTSAQKPEPFGTGYWTNDREERDWYIGTIPPTPEPDRVAWWRRLLRFPTS